MKFKLTAECKEFYGLKLFRIEALIDIPRWGVKAGDKGGWVEKEENLSQVSDDAWVYGNAHVFGDARVSGNAWVGGNAQVYGNARVFGNAHVFGDARVYDDAWVYGDARVSGNAQKTPIFITGLKYPITITDAHMRIGCEFHTLAEWAVFDDERIASMDGVAARHFWKAHRDTLLAIAKAEGRS
jgi:hypothetical protein